MNVLIVDDSKAMRMLIGRGLREMGVPAPYLEAANGRAALAAIANSSPDFVISDLNMPEMSGMELLCALREGGNQTLFGFVTAEASAQLREEAAKAGASFVLTKPFTAAHMSQMIGPLLSEIGCRTKLVESEAPAKLDAGEGLPNVQAMRLALTELLRRDVTPTIRRPVFLAPNLRIVAEYRSYEEELNGCVVCDFGFGARASAALTMIPASAADEVVRSRAFEDAMAENLHEVLNVMARFFSFDDTSRARLGRIYRGEKVDAAVAAVIAKPVVRADFAVEISGYGDGSLSLLSIRLPRALYKGI